MQPYTAAGQYTVNFFGKGIQPVVAAQAGLYMGHTHAEVLCQVRTHNGGNGITVYDHRSAAQGISAEMRRNGLFPFVPGGSKPLHQPGSRLFNVAFLAQLQIHMAAVEGAQNGAFYNIVLSRCDDMIGNLLRLQLQHYRKKLDQFGLRADEKINT